MNIDNKALMRKYNLNILLGGEAIIVYVFWQLLRFLLGFLFNGNTIYENLQLTQEEYINLSGLFFIFITILILVFFSIHIYVGIMAVRFAKGRKKKSRYLIASFLLLLLSFWEAFSNFMTESIDDTVIAAFILDATLCFIVADLIYSTIRYKKLYKLQEKA